MPQNGSPEDSVGSIEAVSADERDAWGALRLATETTGRAVVIRMAGELDLATAPSLTSAVEWAAEQADGLPLVLDMQDVSFIDSTGVRTLLEATRIARRPVALMSPSSAVTRVLDLTRLRGRFLEVDSPDHPDLERA
jgi:anti-sigma B factor antagonist